MLDTLPDNDTLTTRPRELQSHLSILRIDGAHAHTQHQLITNKLPRVWSGELSLDDFNTLKEELLHAIANGRSEDLSFAIRDEIDVHILDQGAAAVERINWYDHRTRVAVLRAYHDALTDSAPTRSPTANSTATISSVISRSSASSWPTPATATWNSAPNSPRSRSRSMTPASTPSWMRTTPLSRT